MSNCVGGCYNFEKTGPFVFANFGSIDFLDASGFISKHINKLISSASVRLLFRSCGNRIIFIGFFTPRENERSLRKGKIENANSL